MVEGLIDLLYLAIGTSKNAMAAAIFHFNSPPGTVTNPRRLYRSRKGLNPGKRRICKMDGFCPRACMARLHDPIFEPNDLDSIFTRCFVRFGGPVGHLSPPLPALVYDDEDDSDDSLGGVALLVDEEKEDVGTVDVHVTLPLDSTSNHSSDSDELVQSRPLLGARDTSPLHSRRRRSTGNLRGHLTTSRIASSILGSSHPRPLTQDIWDEEDSRRLRFALGGADTSEVSRFESRPTELETPRLPSGLVTELTAANPGSSQPRDGPRQRWPSQTEGPQIEYGTANHPTAEVMQQNSLDVESLLFADEERLAVDDPKRNYDFSDFMGSWLLLSKHNKRVAPMPAGSSVPARPSKDYLPRAELHPLGCDIQGVRWADGGLCRNDALKARIELFPSGDLTESRKQRPGLLETPQPAAEACYRFRSFDGRHVANTSHYQLRNLLAATSRSDVFYSSGTRIMRTSLACPEICSPVIDLSSRRSSADAVRITCLTTTQSTTHLNNLLLAGGFCGEYAVLNLASNDPVHEGHVTRAFNGVVTHIHAFRHRRSGSPQAAFCSNDHMLRLMDLDTLRMLQAQSFDYAVNCSATAPDGRLRLVVGDGCDALVTDAERGGTLIKLGGHTDHGFACAWAGNGIHAATGAQDGRTLVWDARNWSQPLKDLPSIMSCPRSVHFADNDDLIVAESDDVVSVYGAGNYLKRQDVRFFGSIAGLALVNGGSELVIANTDRTLGGLLSLERTPSGFNRGTDGERLLAAGRRGLARSSLRYPSALPDLFV